MYQNGHYGAALLFVAPIGALLIAAGFVELALMAGVTAVALAMVPDLDQRVPGVTHRGPTHTVWFGLAVGLLLAAVGTLVTVAPSLVGVVTGFVVGSGTIASHIAADALTPAGVRPLSPVDDTHYSLDVVRAKNPLANYALLGLGIACAALGVWVGSTVASV
ncbi:metal-dependent hydrolase [Haloarcula amylolytica]|uniref:Putative membrane-bound metal-dependent hydrolase n=1 Tax=Haloarcula amylolytica JCM 13557 TaxID=1227452 RepID=M0K7J0_9EURY|nr:metal-dependent hydrolase [Haloarcula amylolytica]EMA17171.1 putative membrane-bound metal-dependent hydrolase [Haloarcula amylolytica JCM 13557]